MLLDIVDLSNELPKLRIEDVDSPLVDDCYLKDDEDCIKLAPPLKRSADKPLPESMLDCMKRLVPSISASSLKFVVFAPAERALLMKDPFREELLF